MLNKYHKQKVDRKTRNYYGEFIKKYQLPYQRDQEHDLIKVSIFLSALAQKNTIEKTYEQVRNENIDMWEYLEFNERNSIVAQTLNDRLSEMYHFNFENTEIYIPFFDRLMNSLYTKETAILELPQFFELYQDFRKRIIDMSLYGVDVYRAGFSYLPCVASSPSVAVLFNDKINVFYAITSNSFKRYPFNSNAKIDGNTQIHLGNLLVKGEDIFLDELIDKRLLKRACVKKILKSRKKKSEI